MEDLYEYNRQAWDRQAAGGNKWTIPVTEAQVRAAARGEWSVLLTPQKPVPAAWFGDLRGRRLLGLASGGGQQGPVFAAAGASVVILDASPAQLARDRDCAALYSLDLTAEEGDMRDLSRFADNTFDLVFHPVSNSFIPDPRPVWREAARVLKPGGRLLSGFCLPQLFLVDPKKDDAGIIDVRFTLPYSDAEQMKPEEIAELKAKGEPLCYGHTLDALLGGQLDAGLVLKGFYEDNWPKGRSAICDRLPCFAATLAVKP
ncbi:MAG TPA: class I SAM-dependent methyltransferase [Elusimicrobiales bacterium]|nr:class I SAM-dependent methyltransferase [Elusimicrobiales bacterium]